MAITPANKATPRPSNDEQPSDVKVISRDEEFFVAEVFGEEFRFSTYVNPWYQLMLMTGENTAQALLQLLHSILEVDVPADATEDEAAEIRTMEADRFSATVAQGLANTRGGFESLFRLVNDLIESAGNETAPSAGD